MKADGDEIPKIVSDLLDSGEKTFYKVEDAKESFFNSETKAFKIIDSEFPKRIEILKAKKTNIVKETDAASLVDIGDESGCWRSRLLDHPRLRQTPAGRAAPW